MQVREDHLRKRDGRKEQIKKKRKRKKRTCDKNARTHGLTWDSLLSFSFYTKPSWYCLKCLKERKKGTDQHKPRRHPRRRCWHASSQARGLSVRLSLCSVRLCPYRASLPMMTPITKKSTQNASTRVLRPSSLTAVVAMVEEWAEANGVTFLFRRPSSSCDEDEESEIQICAYKLTFNLVEFVTPHLNDSLSKSDIKINMSLLDF